MVRSVEALVPPGLVVTIDSPGPSVPPGTRRPLRRRRRSRSAPGQAAGVAADLRGLCFAVVAFGILAIAGGDVSGGIAFVVIGVLTVAWQQLWAQRRVRRGP